MGGATYVPQAPLEPVHSNSSMYLIIYFPSPCCYAFKLCCTCFKNAFKHHDDYVFWVIMFCIHFSHRQNDYGQIGCGSHENVVVPRFVEHLDRVSKVTCGANHNLALTGTVKRCE